MTSAIHIFRVKAGITDPDDIIQDRNLLWSTDVRIRGGLLGVLYVQRSLPRLPGWLGFFQNAVDFSDVSVITSSSAALLLVAREKRLFAVVFGYGRYLLNDGAVESRFGLRVTLNAVDPDQLRSVDHKRLETVSRHTIEQVSKLGSLQQFGLDIERDLLRAVTGVPKDASFGRLLTGGDQLVVVADVTLANLGVNLDRYGRLASLEDYKADFSWIDNIAEVTDGALKVKLDELLADELAKADGQFWLAPPDVIDWTGVSGFRYGGKQSPTHHDLDIDQYFVDRRSRRDVTVENLRTDYVKCVSAEDDSDLKKWSVYSCLVGEVTFKRERFVLSESKWYRVDQDFLSEVEKDIGALPRTKAPLPKGKGEAEADYNRRAAKRSSGELVLLDQDFIQYGQRGKIEVCDLYDRGKIFIHVKHAGASSTLSHLISQGQVSASLMLSEPGFRQALYAKLPSSHYWSTGNPAEAINPRDFEIAYAIIARPGKPLNLPFFSKVNLRNASRALKASGFKVSLTSIPS